MIRILFPLIFLCACQPKRSAFGSWVSQTNDRTLELKAQSSKVVDHEHGCEFEAIVEGDAQSGKLKFSRNQNCGTKHSPKEVVYRTSSRSLLVCTDYHDGDHTCEKFKTP